MTGEKNNQVKSFSLEHKFYGELNSSINFYRGDSKTGGYITFGVDTGTETLKLSKKLLDMNGTIRAQEVKIDVSTWADFVFEPSYNLRPLNEVESFIKVNKHLPEIPSEKEVLESGVNVVEMQAKLLQKIEELTLYVIDQKKENQALKEQLSNQQKQIDKLDILKRD